MIILFFREANASDGNLTYYLLLPFWFGNTSPPTHLERVCQIGQGVFQGKETILFTQMVTILLLLTTLPLKISLEDKLILKTNPMITEGQCLNYHLRSAHYQ